MLLKPRVVNYRRVEFEPAPGDHLQKLLSEKLATPGQGVDMSLTAAQDSPHYVLSQFQKRRGAVCGQLQRFERGRDVPLVDVNAGTGEVWTGTAVPRDNEGNLRNFAEASLYFAVKENHLAVIQSLGFGLSELQAYFQWLLGIDLAPPCDDAPRLFHFRNIPSLGARQAIAGNDISGITIGSNLFNESKIPTVVAEEGKKPRTVNRTEYVIDSSARAILKTVMDAIGMKNSPILDNLDHHADPGSIRMNVSITYASRSTKDAQELMHAIAGGLDDGDFPKASIRLKGGKTIKGEELTIRDSIKLQTVNGNLMVDHALSALTTWLIDQIRGGGVV